MGRPIFISQYSHGSERRHNARPTYSMSAFEEVHRLLQASRRLHFWIVLALTSLVTLLSFTPCEQLNFNSWPRKTLVDGKKGGWTRKGFFRTLVKTGEPIELLSFWPRRELTAAGTLETTSKYNRRGGTQFQAAR